MRRQLRLSSAKQGGFSLIEVVVALTISAFLTTGVAVTIYQIFKENIRATSNMAVVQQVANAGYWVSRDVQMAQTVAPSGDSGFPLTLTWVTWSGDVNQVTYTLAGDEFRRSLSINGGQPNQTVVAEQINADSAMTNCQFAVNMLTFKVTATDGATSATRTHQIKVRSESTS